ncbi:MAG: hypothetical protein HZB25_11180 [Candidatus Eisenbacteria bacterium]|nr:hypothetical protein [Candidatus Eisenbacteria bacterium]
MDTTHASSAAASRQVTPRDFLTVLFRRKWVVLVIPAVALAVVTWVNLSTPPRYSSSTRMLLKRGTRENGLEAGVTILPREEELASQVEITKSIAVTRRAQQILDARPGRRFQINPGGATAGVVGESNVVDITYEASEPEACPAVADALAQAFMEFHRRAFSIPTMAAFFARETDSTFTELQNLRRMKEALLTQQNMVEPEETRKNIMQLQLQQQTSLDQIRTKRVALEAELQGETALAKRMEVELPFTPNTQAGGDSWIVDLKKALQDLRVNLEELRGKFSDTHPQVLALKDQIAEVEAQLRREARVHRMLAEQNLQVIRAQERQLEGSLASLSRQLSGYPSARVRLEELDKMIELTQDLYKQTRERQSQALVASATTPDWTATLLVPAGPAVRMNKHDYVRIALAPMLALAVSIGLAFFVDSLDHSLKSVREVEDVLGLPVVASVPEAK